MKNKLWDMLQEYQATSMKEDGIKFTKEDFTKLYNEAIKANWERIDEVKIESGKGMLIGAASVGLVWLSTSTINKIRKQNLKEVEKVVEKSLREWESGNR